MTITVGCFILLGVLVATILVHGQPIGQEGFVSIDCGTPADYSYTDKTTHIVYSSDAQYIINTGTNKKISNDVVTNSLEVQYSTLRSFPSGIRNCYALKPVDKGYKYLVRAFFLYGNYDGLNSARSDNPIQFDLYIGVNLWETVKIANASKVYRYEVMTEAAMDYLSVCLVNRSMGTPFISSLEMRPLKNKMYPAVNASTALVRYARRSFGADQVERFPGDPYDRIWEPLNEPYWEPISTTSTVAHLRDDVFEAPTAVLSTAVTPVNSTGMIKFHWTDPEGPIRSEYMFVLHCAELVEGASRSFNISLNGEYWAGPWTPTYLLASYVNSISPGSIRQYNFMLASTSSSTLPPIINALEVFTVLFLTELPTDNHDVDAINAIKDHFQVKKLWMGDPCAPRTFAWDGLICTYSVSGSPRITTLNLSTSGITGDIPAFLANLKALEYLDLSNNNLTGEVPDSLAQLSSLKLLNLTGNQLTAVSSLLLDRQQNGSLVLSYTIVNNPDSCNKEGSCKSKKMITAPIIAVLSIVLAVLVVLAWASIWRMRRKRQGLALSTSARSHDKDFSSQTTNFEDSTIQQDSRKFTYIELENITNNFERIIGKGGFGSVYHGYLQNGVQVAVKMRSLSSLQGTKEFLAEAQLLTRVHHRNLVSLVGYYKDESYMALVYEYMAQGSLREHLKDRGGNTKISSWRERLRIALEAAQGLEYLLKGCRPPIIHRDVKSSNILLSEKLEAKIADFGLSKAFHEAATHVSTVVAGTPGYLDPEYYKTYQLNEKSDVYSFGVVLLELITGLPAILTGPETCHITQWVWPRLSRGSITDVVDTRLGEKYELNSMWKVADLAMRCTESASAQRPSMADVVLQLKEALELEVFHQSSQNPCMDNLQAGQTVSTDIAGLQMNSMLDGPSMR